MSHAAVRAFIGDTAKAVKDTIQFGYGRTEEFNSKADNSRECIWLDPLIFAAAFTNLGTNNLSITWNVAMFFYKFDSIGSIETEYSKILDETNQTLLKFVSLLNYNPGESTTDSIRTDNVLLSNFRGEPVIKVTKDYMTGWTLTFQITVPDTFDYCSIYDS